MSSPQANFRCLICTKDYVQEKRLQSHIRNKHPNMDPHMYAERRKPDPAPRPSKSKRKRERRKANAASQFTKIASGSASRAPPSRNSEVVNLCSPSPPPSPTRPTWKVSNPHPGSKEVNHIRSSNADANFRVMKGNNTRGKPQPHPTHTRFPTPESFSDSSDDFTIIKPDPEPVELEQTPSSDADGEDDHATTNSFHARVCDEEDEDAETDHHYVSDDVLPKGKGKRAASSSSSYSSDSDELPAKRFKSDFWGVHIPKTSGSNWMDKLMAPKPPLFPHKAKTTPKSAKLPFATSPLMSPKAITPVVQHAPTQTKPQPAPTQATQATPATDPFSPPSPFQSFIARAQAAGRRGSFSRPEAPVPELPAVSRPSPEDPVDTHPDAAPASSPAKEVSEPEPAGSGEKPESVTASEGMDVEVSEPTPAAPAAAAPPAATSAAPAPAAPATATPAAAPVPTVDPLPTVSTSPPAASAIASVPASQVKDTTPGSPTQATSSTITSPAADANGDIADVPAQPRQPTQAPFTCAAAQCTTCHQLLHMLHALHSMPQFQCKKE